MILSIEETCELKQIAHTRTNNSLFSYYTIYIKSGPVIKSEKIKYVEQKESSFDNDDDDIVACDHADADGWTWPAEKNPGRYSRAENFANLRRR